MPSLFIGSSTEASERGIVSILIQELYDVFDVRPWQHVFEQGRFALETLVNLSHEVDLALLIFSKDDSRDSRGQSDFVTRDNVILEYGIFLSQLGRDRVWLLQEEGVVLPTDLMGLNYRIFPSSPNSQGKDIALEESLKGHAREIKSKWRTKSPILQEEIPIDDGRLGLVSTLKLLESDLEEVSVSLTRFTRDKSHISEPFLFDSNKKCITAYAGGLGLVKTRFDTTSYIFSGFWANGDLQILEANEEMLKRIKDNSGVARRLFLLSRPLLDEVEAEKQKFIHLRHQMDEDALENLHASFDNLRSSFNELSDKGCLVRVVHDKKEYERFPNQIKSFFHAGDSEIAIYDDFRVDIFAGGKLGYIKEVRIYTEATAFFSTILQGARRYFESLWEDSVPAQDFINRLAHAYDSAKRRIDYTPNWLAMFEFGLNANDRDLKTIEASRVKEGLKFLGRWGTIGSYLDVGTCTARYPLELREAVNTDGKIIGLDDDLDAVKFAEAQCRDKAPGDSRITIIQQDFGAQEIYRISGKFDLITCMLGTLSHFGWDREENFDDHLQMILNRFKSFLGQNGILIISSWSDHAKEKRDMLGIYREWDRNLLSEWTPGSSELKRRLNIAGLNIIREFQPEDRLNIYFCGHKHPRGPRQRLRSNI